TISHTLTALQVLTRRNLDVAAVIVSESEGSAAVLEDTVATIARFSGAIDVIGIPRLADAATAHPAFAAIARLLLAESLSAAPLDNLLLECLRVDAIQTSHVDRHHLGAVRSLALGKGLDAACGAEAMVNDVLVELKVGGTALARQQLEIAGGNEA